LPDREALLAKLQIEAKSQHSTIQSINNQYPEFLGKHNLKNGKNLLEALKEPIDLIVVDNYMDITPALKEPLGDKGKRIFLNTSSVLNETEVFSVQKFGLPPEDSARNLTRILHYFRALQPNAVIVFMHFPYNLYPSVKRHEKCMEFIELFDPKVIDPFMVVPTQFIAQKFMHRDPQHYQAAQYMFYAGIIYQTLLSRNVPLNISSRIWSENKHILEPEQ
jgi:hypothetical protein